VVKIFIGLDWIGLDWIGLDWIYLEKFVVKIFIFYVQELVIASDWTEGSATGLRVQRLD
jgi:hypothetical protein